MTTHDPQLDDMIAGYALGALPEDERREVERLLQTSGAAREALRAYQETLAGFALAIPKRQAPAALEAWFRARLAAEATRPQAGTRATPAQARRSAVNWRPLVAIAAVALVALGVLYVLLTGESRAIAAIVNNPAAQRIPIVAQAGGTGTISLVAVSGSQDAVLEAEVPALAAGQQYQLWFIGGGAAPQIMSGGVFDPAPGSTRQVLVKIPDLTQSYKIGITIEPTGGSPQPTMSPIFLGDLPPLAS